MFTTYDNTSARWASFVSGLALRDCDLRTALALEYESTLYPVIDETLGSLPDYDAERLRSVIEKMSADGGVAAASARALTDDEVRSVADTLVELAFVVSHHRPPPADD